MKVLPDIPDKKAASLMDVLESISYVKAELVTEENTPFSPALPGSPMTNEAFVKWIKNVETMPRISLNKAEMKWKKERNTIEELFS